MVSQAFSNTFFKRFSHEDRIPQTMLILNIGWLVLSGVGLWLLADWLVPILFGEDFAIVSEYAKGLIFAYFFQGLYQPYMFLTAKSKGKAIRNIDFLEAGVNLAGNILLIPWIGVWGAIYTSILAKFIHYAGKLWLYHRYKTNKL
jgi:O-antigen/teichoic acid export membrane protein